MAQQTGSLLITGSIRNITFYTMRGKYYARMKSSLEGKRVKKDPVFRETMQYAALLAKASVIGSKVYQQLPMKIRERKIFQQITGKAMKLLKDGLRETDVFLQLKTECSIFSPILYLMNEEDKSLD